MYNSVRKLMVRHYPIFNPLWKIYFPLRQGRVHQPLKIEDKGNVFEEIYKNNYWTSEESKSGIGSTLEFTTPIRARLPRLLNKYKVSSILDAPCGDFNWMSHVNLGDRHYTGGDIVSDLVLDTQKRYGGPHRKFIIYDIVSNEVPPVDLWICRDILFHLTFGDALRVLERAASSKIRFFLSTTFNYVKDNIDLESTGGFRSINLQRAPFNLPPPIEQLDDFVVPRVPRSLGLWRRDQIESALEKRVPSKL
jgi:hypothetical protein